LPQAIESLLIICAIPFPSFSLVVHPNMWPIVAQARGPPREQPAWGAAEMLDTENGSNLVEQFFGGGMV
jgi:hypothetical protein